MMLNAKPRNVSRNPCARPGKRPPILPSALPFTRGISAFITPLDARRLDVRVAANVDGDGSALRAWQEELRADISGLEGVVT